MQGVVVDFQFAGDFDRARVAGISREPRGRFEGMPGLRQKAFMVDEPNRRAMNVYLWDSEETTCSFFSNETVERVTALHGVRRAVPFVDVVELVDNSE